MNYSRAATLGAMLLFVAACSGHKADNALPVVPNRQAGVADARATYQTSLMQPSEIGKVIDPRLPESEQAFLKKLLASIPASFANKNGLDYNHYAIAIIDAQTKQITYNRTELKGTLMPARLSIPVDPRPPSNEPGSRHDQYWAPSTFDEHSGPYRRIYTPPNANTNVVGPSDSGDYPAGETADLYLPCGSAVNRSGTSNGIPYADQAYAYMGGWSQYYNYTGGNVDAGLMSNAGVQSTSLDNYTLFMRLNGIGAWDFQAKTSDGQIINGLKIPCSPYKIHMEFYVAPNFPGYTLVLSVDYFDVSRNANYGATIGWYFSEPTSGGWWASCQSCVLKRMSSIGQDVNHQSSDNLGDGSTFRVQWQNATVSCGFAPILCTPAGSESVNAFGTGNSFTFVSA